MSQSLLQNNSTRLVQVQISCSNPDVIPVRLKTMPRKATKKHDQGEPKNGRLFFEPTMNGDVLTFLDQLVDAGYQLVDASYTTPPDRKDPSGRRVYNKLSFTFVPKEFVDISDGFRRVREFLMDDLMEMCDLAMWRVQAHVNPFFENGVAVEGLDAISVDLKARVPLFEADGETPIKQWKRDAKGQKIGTEPVDRTPDFCFLV